LKLTVFVTLLNATVGLFLYARNKRTLLVISPIAATLAFVFDILGTHFNFWRIKPFWKRDIFHSIPIHLGIYPLLSGYMIHFIELYKTPLLFISVFGLITTTLEWFYLRIKKLKYSRGWNIFWTFISYLTAYSLVFTYYRLLIKHDIIQEWDTNA
jgi:hypothetical protein